MEEKESIFVENISKDKALKDYKNLLNVTRIKTAINYIDEKSTVLDIGCSYWYISYYLANEKWCKVDWIELNNDRLDLAKEYFPHKNINYKQADFTVMDNQKKYDFIILLEVIEHLENPFFSLEKIHWLLNPGGYLIISTPNANDYLQSLANLRLIGNGSFINVTSVGLSTAVSSGDNLVIVANVASGLVAGHLYELANNNDTTAYIEVETEL